MSHTPAPWVAERDPCHFDTLSSVRAGNGALHVEIGGKARPPEQEANARLIASAPVLLGVGKRLIAFEANARAGDPEAQSDFDRAMVDLRAAIDEATSNGI